MLFEFTRDFVFYKTIDNYELVNEYLMKEIKSRRGKESRAWDICDTVTSFLNEPEFNAFLNEEPYINDILWNPLDEMLESVLDFRARGAPIPSCSKIRNFWYNVYPRGNFQEIHNHRGSGIKYDDGYYYPSYSAIYIVDDGGAANTTVFTKTQDVLGNPGQHRENFDTSEENSIGTGTIILFPCYLDHYVVPNLRGNERVTVTYNIDSLYPDSSYSKLND